MFDGHKQKNPRKKKQKSPEGLASGPQILPRTTNTFTTKKRIIELGVSQGAGVSFLLEKATRCAQTSFSGRKDTPTPWHPSPH